MKKIAYFLMRIANWMVKRNNDPSWQTKQEMECAKEGHIWTKFDNNNDLSNPIKNRIFCRRCGQMYHEHTYINNI